jgi:hypothetical protein
MKQIVLLRITGITGFLFALFHLAFPLMPNWNTALKSLPDDYASIFLTYHYIIIVFLVGMGYIGTFKAKSIVDNPLKISILTLFSSLYIIRIITEFVCWGITFPQSAIILPI